MIEYFKTPITWYKTQERNQYNDFVASPGIDLKVWLEWGLKEILDQQGNKTMAVATIISDQKIGLDDYLVFESKKWKVKSYTDINDFDNKFLFREVYL